MGWWDWLRAIHRRRSCSSLDKLEEPVYSS
jgi:hypothetical protein